MIGDNLYAARLNKLRSALFDNFKILDIRNRTDTLFVPHRAHFGAPFDLLEIGHFELMPERLVILAAIQQKMRGNIRRFAGFTGQVDEIVTERRRVKVVVTIFGRPTPIDLDFLDVQPI